MSAQPLVRHHRHPPVPTRQIPIRYPAILLSMSQSTEDEHWNFNELTDDAEYLCMVRVTFNLPPPQKRDRLRSIWDQLLSTGIVLAAKRTSWGSIVATSNDPQIAAEFVQLLNTIGWDSFAIVICEIPESIDASMKTLEAELLDHNAYWQGIKLMSPDSRKRQSVLSFSPSNSQ